MTLEDAGIQDRAKQVKFARLFNEHKALTPELLESLDRDPSFMPSEIADLQTSFQLADITRGNFSVIGTIKHEFSIHQPEDIRLLAKKSGEEWISFVRTKYAAGEIELPFEVGDLSIQAQLPKDEIYGQMLDRQFREVFPTTAFAGGLDRALQNGGVHGLKHATELSTFLERHADFELLNTPVDEFLDNYVTPELQPLAQDESFRLEVKATQRVFKLIPVFEATDALLADGLHSAQTIYRMGESEFVRQFADRPGFIRETARLTWNRAADTYAAVLTLISDLKALEPETLPQALRNENANEALSNFPNWKNLFQAGDLCECPHCGSVLSPAAYFVDILMFLKDRRTTDKASSVKDILLNRRPDLGFLELNCANALTTLPYIDVVCEVLEDAIDAEGENDLMLPGLTVIPVDESAAKIVVEQAFQDAFQHRDNHGKEKLELGNDFSLSQVDSSNPNYANCWVVHGENVTYLLKKKAASPNFFAEILPNTKASAAELKAYPQYVNPKVYTKLRQAKYPQALPLDLFPEGDSRRLEQRTRSFSLPFDLFTEEVRAGFQKTNLQRWDLMRAFRGNATPTDGDIAAEYFGISVGGAPAEPSEYKLILEAKLTEAEQQEIWGEKGNADWRKTYNNVDSIVEKSVCNVRYFLQKTGLEYNELLALIDLAFINQVGDINIQHLDSSCDTDKKVILGLDAAKLDRIHRFLRLWRKLKTWKLWELELVIRHPRIGNRALDESLLIHLFYFSELKKKLGRKTSVEQVCALFGNLNTATRFTKLHEKREDALYQTLFLNKRLNHPIDPAFNLDSVTGDLPVGETIAAHHLPFLGALGIREADLILLKELTKPDGSPYVKVKTKVMPDGSTVRYDLTLENLSFLWRQAWLAKMLKFKVKDWTIVLKLFQLDIQEFTTPQSAWKFIEKIDHFKATGFKPDELNWLLAGDRSAKAALKETDATRFLATLRKEIQSIQAEYNSEQYDFLTVTPPTDEDSLTPLLTSLLQKLNRSETEVSDFLKLLRGRVLLEVAVKELPAGFAFPAAITGAPNHIPIAYDEANQRLRFTGLMTKVQQEILTNNASPALATLHSSAKLETAIQELPSGFTFPVTITGAPNNIPIQYDKPNQRFRFKGLMTKAQRDTLTDDASPALVTLYSSGQLETAVQGLPAGFVFPAAITGAPNNIPIQYDESNQRLRFTGLVTQVQQATLLNDASLVAVVATPAYRTAIEELYRQSFKVVNNYQTAIEDLYQQSLKVVNNYRLAIEDLYQQSLQAVSNYWSMEIEVTLPSVFYFPLTITGNPNAIPIRCEQVLRFTGEMTVAQRNTLLNDAALAAVTGIDDYKEAIQKLFDLPRQSVVVKNLPANFSFPTSITGAPNHIPIRLGHVLRFTGVMTPAQQNTLENDSSLGAVTGIKGYQTAIAEMIERPHMAMKFFEPVFTAFLAKLPAEVDFQGQLPTDLAEKITYDPEQEWLCFTGIMNDTEKTDILALSGNVAYATAVNSLATQPQTIAIDDERIWLTDADLDIAHIERDTYAKRLANAAKKALNYLSKTSSENAVVQQSSAQLGLTGAVSRYLLSNYAVVPNPADPKKKTLLSHLTGNFTIDSTTLNGWFWANRVAAILKTWKIALAEWKKMSALTDGAQLLDFLTIPLDSTGEIVPVERFLRTSRLIRLRDRLPETKISLLEIFAKLNDGGTYAKDDFANDVQRLNEAWLKADVKALTDALNLTYPDDYLLVENWERLRRAFYFIDNLNASADSAKIFAAATMTPDHAKALKELLRSKFASETWLTLSAEIQDALRERKRDALSAYLLTQPEPAAAPSGKWENSNDLYAYYLLDVEMCSCQLTSRLVQGSGSVQLFVQRCFMGLEPEVLVDDRDSAWRWWKWMRKYRVWEANRKVFLWPENWIEPELKKDRSPFFKDLENELLENEIKQETVEKAFINYLEKLDSVAQLEIAGFYQEDDGNNTILHVFGRTTGVEPYLYYYRRYDYRQWTPWEKVDLDIQGDYLIPAVVNKRLFLLWPVFTEIPDEQANSTVEVSPFEIESGDKKASSNSSKSVQRAKKKLRLQIALSEYRQKKWTPKRVSKEFNESESAHDVELVRKHYQFFPVDFGKGISIQYSGESLGSDRKRHAFLKGAFKISSCKGYPEKEFHSMYNFLHVSRPEKDAVDKDAVDNDTVFLKWVELENRDYPDKDFSLENKLPGLSEAERLIQVLRQTMPGTFKIIPPWHPSYLDRLTKSVF